MTRLLNANFARMFKGKLFYICAVLAVILGVMEIIPHYSQMEDINPETFLFNESGFFIQIITAVLVGIFVGEEHSGVLRNKIIVGQKRLSVYLSDLIACSASIVIIHILHFGSILTSVVLFGGKIEVSASIIAVYELLQLTSLLGVCALFTAAAMLIPKKFAGTVAALTLIIGLYYIYYPTSERLKQLDDKYYFDSVKELGITEDELAENEFLYNTFKITDAELAERGFLRFAMDILPFGQDEQIRRCFNSEVQKVNPTEPVPAEIALYSLGTVAVTTAVGVLVFRKKDIK